MQHAQSRRRGLKFGRIKVAEPAHDAAPAMAIETIRPKAVNIVDDSGYPLVHEVREPSSPCLKSMAKRRVVSYCLRGPRFMPMHLVLTPRPSRHQVHCIGCYIGAITCLYQRFSD